MFSRTTTKSMSLRALVLQRRVDARVELHGPQVDVLIQLETQSQQNALLQNAGLHVRVADGAEEDGVVTGQLFAAESGRISPVRR